MVDYLEEPALEGTSICPLILAKSGRTLCLFQMGLLRHHKWDLAPLCSTAIYKVWILDRTSPFKVRLATDSLQTH